MLLMHVLSPVCCPPPPPLPSPTAGDERFDLGVAVKDGRESLCVPGFSTPTADNSGWMYSGAMLTILQEYRRVHGWVWDYLVRSGGNTGDSGKGGLPAILQRRR